MDQDHLTQATEYLKSLRGGVVPTVGVICGSGLSGLANCLEDKQVVDYTNIPHFPQTTIVGHTGELVFGKVDVVNVVLMRGRFHSYEGHDMKTVTMPVKLMRSLGVEILIVTNAAGGLNRSFNVGDIMIISDHIGFPMLAGNHPLVGLNDTTFGGARFPPMSDAYDKALQQLVWETATPLKMHDYMRRSGTYAFVSGPTYETGAESKMLLMMGCDSVGMSTVPEVAVARHCGMKVIGLSLITSSVRMPGDVGPVASHEEVIDTVNERAEAIQNLVKNVISKLENETLAKIEGRLENAADSYEARKASASLSLNQRLESIDINSMTPLEALQELHKLKKMASITP